LSPISSYYIIIRSGSSIESVPQKSPRVGPAIAIRVVTASARVHSGKFAPDAARAKND
jgi:hypothetical protein